MSLSYGLRTHPADRPVWGARFIWPADLVHDRQDVDGNVDALIEWLNGGALEAARDVARSKAASYQLRPTEDREVTLYEDESGIVKANPQASHGYLYVAAWLKGDDEPWTCPQCRFANEGHSILCHGCGWDSAR